MRSILTTLLAITCLFTSHSVAAAPADSVSYMVWVVQGNTRIQLEKGVKHDIKLQRQPFRFEFQFIHTDGISGRTGFTNSEYKTPPDQQYADCEHLLACGGAEMPDNQMKDICIYNPQDMSCLAWYQWDSVSGRFDPGSYRKSGDTMFVTRTIKQIYDYKTTGYVNISRLKMPIYVTFHRPEAEPCTRMDHNLEAIPDRRYVKITFE